MRLSGLGCIATAVLTLSPALGCGGGAQQKSCGSPTCGPPPSNVITNWPTFSGDCQAQWSDTLMVINSNAYSNPGPLIGLEVADRIPGSPSDPTDLELDFNPADVGLALSLDPNETGETIKMTFIVESADAPDKTQTTYSQFDQGLTGAVHGTVTIQSYDPAAGTASILFSNAALVGEDAVYSGTFRCGINGTLKVASFARTALGARCQTDLECGGGYSGRVCDNNTFVCVQGCHAPTDCPLNQTCNTTSSTCA